MNADSSKFQVLLPIITLLNKRDFSEKKNLIQDEKFILMMLYGYGISIWDIMCIEYRYTCIHSSDTQCFVDIAKKKSLERKSMTFMSSFNPNNHISRVLPPVIS